MFIRTELLNNNDTYTVTTTHVTEDLKYLFKQIRESGHKRSENYVLTKSLEQSYAFSVTYLNDEPALCSVAFERPMYEGAIRLATRYGVRPDLNSVNFGKGMENFQRLDVIDHFNQQIEICERLGADAFFISQEAKVGGRRLKALSQTMSKYTKFDWTVSEEPVWVIPDRTNLAGLQYVVSNKQITFGKE